MTLTSCAARCAKLVPPQSSPADETASTVRYDKQRYRDRHLVENASCRLKDFRRIATRYDKLAANFASAVALASIIAFWC